MLLTHRIFESGAYRGQFTRNTLIKDELADITQTRPVLAISRSVFSLALFGPVLYRLSFFFNARYKRGWLYLLQLQHLSSTSVKIHPRNALHPHRYLELLSIIPTFSIYLLTLIGPQSTLRHTCVRCGLRVTSLRTYQVSHSWSLALRFEIICCGRWKFEIHRFISAHLTKIEYHWPEVLGDVVLYIYHYFGVLRSFGRTKVQSTIEALSDYESFYNLVFPTSSVHVDQDFPSKASRFLGREGFLLWCFHCLIIALQTL